MGRIKRNFNKKIGRNKSKEVNAIKKDRNKGTKTKTEQKKLNGCKNCEANIVKYQYQEQFLPQLCSHKSWETKKQATFYSRDQENFEYVCFFKKNRFNCAIYHFRNEQVVVLPLFPPPIHRVPSSFSSSFWFSKSPDRGRNRFQYCRPLHRLHHWPYLLSFHRLQPMANCFPIRPNWMVSSSFSSFFQSFRQSLNFHRFHLPRHHFLCLDIEWKWENRKCLLNI